ncbi:DUF5018 domain-containing protein [Rufibacter glacialis]|uniref:DUF5018 domain-containing protein n=1 Tax=Rufibacter glacialis TaxID=1259555 RepID=A0A5M8QM65_9BACT|nr:DUF5018 domain-containing protein [Rufibacter glacialis]KAA6435322.1 DUF5018 domain-containing protein [Rufibacter glacialis]GGK62332.1 hypothetical protein GCM10011405_08060 [Rufibacter glacialis]
MKRYFYSCTVFLLSLLFLTGCETPEPFENSENNQLSDIWLTIPGQKDARFNGKYSATGETITFEIPHFFPAESDNGVDLKNLVLRANIPVDARITPALGNPMDLTQPVKIDVASGTGAVKSYWIEVKKVADLSVRTVSIMVDGQEITGFERNGELVFYVVPGVDVSNATLNIGISRHSTSSIPSGSQINLTNPVPVKITGVDGTNKTYTLVAVPPQKLNYGIGITRKLFVKAGSEVGGFGAHTETSLSVSGDYVIVGTNTTPSRYRILNRITGALVGNMTMPSASFRSFSMVSDEAGHIIGSSFTPKGSNFLIYKWDNAMDQTPELLITYKNESSSTTDGALGRRLSVYGNLNTNAVIMATESRNQVILKWVVSGGKLVSQTPEKITYGDPIGAWTFISDAQPISSSPNTDFFLNYVSEIALVSGTTGKRISAMPNTPALVGAFHTPIDYFEFNNAKYVGIVEYLAISLDKARIAIFDVTDPSKINGASMATKIFTSDQISGAANPNGTADIEVVVSPDGEKAWAYLLLTNGGIIGYELTNYDPN